MELKQVIQVFCSKCSEWVEEDDTIFEGVEEDMMGQDVLTFICPNCETKQTSFRILKG